MPPSITLEPTLTTEDMETNNKAGDKHILKQEDGLQTSCKRRCLNSSEISTGRSSQTDKAEIVSVGEIANAAPADLDAPRETEVAEEKIDGTIQVTHKAVQEREPATPEPVLMSLLASRLEKVSATTISDEVGNIWNLVNTLTLRTITAKASQNAKASLVDDPSPGLPRLYTLLFGPDWTRRFFIMNSSKSWTRRKALEACLNVAIYALVFEDVLPWDGPEEAVAQKRSELAMYDRVLRDCGAVRDMEFIEWKVAAMKPRNADFQQNVMKPAADKIASRIFGILDLQLQDLKLTDHENPRPGFREHMLIEISKLVKRALILRGKMRAAPEYYRWGWAYSGSACNDYMEDLRLDTGRRQVEWALTPRIQVREMKGTEWETVTLAKVYTRKL